MSPNNNYLHPKVSLRYDTLGSTNAAAIAALGSDHPPAHGDVILTEEQTAGRGQGANAWHASAGDNLTLSLVVQPDHLTADRLFVLSQFTALAIATAVSDAVGNATGTAVRVKWPNDVYVGDRKIAGVLVQNGLRGGLVSWSVIGIGLNVNETDFPPALAPTAVSLRQLTGRPVDRETVLNSLLNYLGAFYPFCFPDAPTGFSLDEAYHRSLYRRGLPTEFILTATGQRFTGIIRGVDEMGRLWVEQSVGREALFVVGEISLG